MKARVQYLSASKKAKTRIRDIKVMMLQRPRIFTVGDGIFDWPVGLSIMTGGWVGQKARNALVAISGP